MFHADPHPGNFLLSASGQTAAGEGKPVLLDFGLVKKLQRPVQLGLARLVLGSHHLIEALTEASTAQGSVSPANLVTLAYPSYTQLLQHSSRMLFRRQAAATEAQDRAKAARSVVLEGFTELGFPIADENVGLMLDVAVFLFRPSQTAAEAEAERVANEEKAMQKVLSTSNDKEMVRRSLG